MEEEKLIKYEDFFSIKINIKLRNLVSNTVVDSKVKAIGDAVGQASEDNLIQFLEIIQNGFILSVPSYTCSIRHNLEIEISVADCDKKPFKMRVFGYVKDLEKTSHTQDRITVGLKQSDKSLWKEFCKIFSDKQVETDEFFQRVRGY